MNISNNPYMMLSVIIICFSLSNHLSYGTDTISGSESLSGDQTIISSGGSFELGFFQPGNSSNKFYIGMWYKKISRRTIVWVANRDTPISNKYSSLLRILNGNLVLLNESQNTVWSTNIKNSTSTSNNSVVATLRDDGNLVLEDGSASTQQPVWQSFDYPTHTFLPGNKIGFNKRTNTNQILTSWKNSEDPAPGLFSLELDPNGSQYLIRWNRSKTYWTSGFWNGERFSAIPEMRLNYIYNFSYVNNANESYFTYSLYNPSIISRFIMDVSGQIQQLTWLDNSGGFGSGFFGAWNLFWSQPRQQCDVHAYCGAFSTCNQTVQPLCNCLPSFVPKSGNDWNLSDFSGGCVRNTSPNNDTNTTSSNTTSTNNNKAVVIGSVIGSFAVSVAVMGLVILRRWKNKQGGRNKSFKTRFVQSKRHANLLNNNITQGGSADVPFFQLKSIIAATDGFSVANKLGQGGFGPVYKGNLPSGQKIAVKRLSNNSGQGIREFKNEVVLISKLQHQNLVKLLGFCVEGDEKLLIYEYMPNKSLDAFLSGSSEIGILDWDQIYNIIEGIARGLLYLHRDSRLRVIHRDLKPSNILLDEDMNPKISDFGMAKMFGRNQTLANTNRIVGTYGYMSPEYAMQGLFSEKSDIFSYGVLLLEIVSSKKNSSFYYHENHMNLLGYAWQLWNEGKALELLDPRLANSRSPSQAMRCIHVGLLCVQEQANDRPTMSTIVFMLCNEATLPTPKKPAFILDRGSTESDSPLPNNLTCSRNCVSITTIEAR